MLWLVCLAVGLDVVRGSGFLRPFLVFLLKCFNDGGLRGFASDGDGAF